MAKKIVFEEYSYDVMCRWPQMALLVVEAKNNEALETAIKGALAQEHPVSESPFIDALNARGISPDEVNAFIQDIVPYYPDVGEQTWYIEPAQQ